MRNKVLSIFHSVIPYVKELRAMAGSMEGCILMQQLDYWFALKPDGFYKFLEPVQSRGTDEQGNPMPGHPLYRVGDSWCEELNCTAHEFRRMFDAIGVRWNSKGEFTKAADPFCGRGYCSYVDRKQNLTFYFRNHTLVDAFLDRFGASGAHNLSTSQKRSTDLGGSNPQSSQKLASIEQRLPPEITSTTTGGAWRGVNPETPTPVWQEGELRGGLEEFIAAAYWMQHRTRGVRSSVGFKSKVRNRIMIGGPNAEDWDTLRLWRASRPKPTPAENLEAVERTAEKQQRLANVRRRYAAMDAGQQAELESRFILYLQADEPYAYLVYGKSGLSSPLVTKTFFMWLLGQLA